MWDVRQAALEEYFRKFRARLVKLSPVRVVGKGLDRVTKCLVITHSLTNFAHGKFAFRPPSLQELVERVYD